MHISLLMNPFASKSNSHPSSLAKEVEISPQQQLEALYAEMIRILLQQDINPSITFEHLKLPEEEALAQTVQRIKEELNDQL